MHQLIVSLPLLEVGTIETVLRGKNMGFRKVKPFVTGLSVHAKNNNRHQHHGNEQSPCAEVPQHMCLAQSPRRQV